MSYEEQLNRSLTSRSRLANARETLTRYMTPSASQIQVPQINASGRPLRVAASHANQLMQQQVLYESSRNEQNRNSSTSQRGRLQDIANDVNNEEDETDDESFEYPIIAAKTLTELLQKKKVYSKIFDRLRQLTQDSAICSSCH